MLRLGNRIGSIRRISRNYNEGPVKKLVQLVVQPPAPSYRFYKLWIWTWMITVMGTTTLITGAYGYHLFKKFQRKRQDEMDKAEYEAEKSKLVILESSEVMGWNFGSGVVNMVSRFLSIVSRITFLALIFGPLVWMYPLVSWNAKMYRNVWCAYLLWALRVSGPCFIKLGQWLGTRRDLFSDALIETCSWMHSHGEIHSQEESIKTIESIYGKLIDELFISFDDEILASGSIAQIHTGRLREDPEKLCVIKVRHPNVDYQIYRDLYILKQVSSILHYIIPSFEYIRANEIFNKFADDMYAQTNMATEALNLLRFKHNFKRYDEIIFPSVVTTLPVHPSVLIESYEEGTLMSKELSRLDTLTTECKNKIANLGVNMFLKMMLVDNFMHADLHPGNILLRITDSGPKLVVLDAGLTSSLSEIDKRNFLDLFAFVAEGDGFGAADIMVKRSRNFEQLKQTPENIEQFTFEMSKLISQVVVKPLQSLEVGKILSSVLDLGKKYQVVIESNFTTLVIGTIIIEGLGKTLNPNFEFIKTAKPFLVGDKAIRDAFIRGQLHSVLKEKNWTQKILEWLDLAFSSA